MALTHAARRRRRAWRADRATSAPWPQRWANASQANGFADQGPQEVRFAAVAPATRQLARGGWIGRFLERAEFPHAPSLPPLTSAPIPGAQGNGRAVSTRTGTGSSRSAIPGPDTGSGLDADAARYIADQYRRLLELGALISAKTNVTDACEKLIQAAAGIVGAERVTLLVVDRMSSDLYVAASDCPAADAPGSDDSCRIPLDESTFAGSCATVRADQRGTQRPRAHPVPAPFRPHAPLRTATSSMLRTRSATRGDSGLAGAWGPSAVEDRPPPRSAPPSGTARAGSSLFSRSALQSPPCCTPQAPAVLTSGSGPRVPAAQAQHRVRSGPAVPASLQPSHSGFSATDERLISKLAEFSGTALDKLTLFERSEADRHRMHGLVRVMERLASGARSRCSRWELPLGSPKACRAV